MSHYTPMHADKTEVWDESPEPWRVVIGSWLAGLWGYLLRVWDWLLRRRCHDEDIETPGYGVHALGACLPGCPWCALEPDEAPGAFGEPDALEQLAESFVPPSRFLDDSGFWAPPRPCPDTPRQIPPWVREILDASYVDGQLRIGAIA